MLMMQCGTFKLKSTHPSVTDGGNTTTFEQIDFPTPFPPGSEVAVLVTMQTFNGCESPGLRVAEVTPSGFRIRENEIVVHGDGALSDGKHMEEVVAWLAFVAP